MPRRSPPPPPSSREQLQSISPESEKEMQHSRPSHGTKGNSSGGGPLGAFWSTQHAHDSQVVEDNPPIFDDERITFKHNHAKPEKRHSVHGNSLMGFNDSMADAFEINFSPEKTSSHAETKRSSQNETFNAFNINLDSFTPNRNSRSGKEEKLEAEVARLREQLKQTNLEKAEITSKYEKLSAICSFQGQELQELKQVLAASSPPPRKDNLKTPEPLQREKIEGTVWGDLHKGMLTNSPSSSPEPNQWQAFAEEPKTQATTTPETVNPKSVRTSNGHRNSIKQPPANPAMDEWGFGHDSFKADTSPASVISRGSSEGSTSQRFSWGETKKAESSQPVGWAGF